MRPDVVGFRLRELFCKAGNIKGISFIKGFAKITFYEDKAANKALNDFQGIIFDGQKLLVEKFRDNNDLCS